MFHQTFADSIWDGGLCHLWLDRVTNFKFAKFKIQKFSNHLISFYVPMSLCMYVGCHASHATKKSLYKYEYPISLRLCFITGMLFGLLINIIYSSTILSALSVPISVIQSFEDLLEQGYKFSTHHLSQPMQNVLKVRTLNEKVQ